MSQYALEEADVSETLGRALPLDFPRGILLNAILQLVFVSI